MECRLRGLRASRLAPLAPQHGEVASHQREAPRGRLVPGCHLAPHRHAPPVAILRRPAGSYLSMAMSGDSPGDRPRTQTLVRHPEAPGRRPGLEGRTTSRCRTYPRDDSPGPASSPGGGEDSAARPPAADAKLGEGLWELTSGPPRVPPPSPSFRRRPESILTPHRWTPASAGVTSMWAALDVPPGSAEDRPYPRPSPAFPRAPANLIPVAESRRTLRPIPGHEGARSRGVVCVGRGAAPAACVPATRRIGGRTAHRAVAAGEDDGPNVPGGFDISAHG